jgi:hypothetical protein
MDRAEERADRQRGARIEPGSQLVPRPAIHAGLAPSAALTLAHEYRPTTAVEVALGERQRLADPESRPPKDDHEAPQAQPVPSAARGAHDGNNLLDVRRIRGIAQAFIPRWPAAVIAGQGCRRTATTSRV